MYNNIITVSSSKKKSGKNDGLKSVLGLSQDLVDFQEKVSSKIDENLSGEYLELVKELEECLICMNKKLLDLASSNMISRKADIDISDEVEDLEDNMEEEIEDEMVVTKEKAEDSSYSDLNSVFMPKSPSQPFSIR